MQMCQDARVLGLALQFHFGMSHDYFVRTRDESSVGITFDRNYVAPELRFNIKDERRGEEEKVLFGRNSRISKVAKGTNYSRGNEKKEKKETSEKLEWSRNRKFTTDLRIPRAW